MSTQRKAADVPVDDVLQALSLAPGLPLAPDDEAVVPPGPETKPDSLLDRVLRSHPALTREEAIADILEFGGDPFFDAGVIHAWRRSGQPAYERTPIEPDGEALLNLAMHGMEAGDSDATGKPTAGE